MTPLLLPLAGLLAFAFLGTKRASDQSARVAAGPTVLPVATTPAEVAAAETALEAATQEDWQSAVAAAIASGDAATVDAVAARMAAAGMAQQARSVRQAADELRFSAAQETNAVREELVASGDLPAGTPTVSVDDVRAAEAATAPRPPAPNNRPGRRPIGPPTPVISVPEVIVSPAPHFDSAIELTRYLQTTSRYRENRGAVADYQAAAGLVADGLYGPATALSIAELGVLPVLPFYWPASNTAQAVAEFASDMLDQAADDPARAAQWRNLADRAGQ